MNFRYISLTAFSSSLLFSLVACQPHHSADKSLSNTATLKSTLLSENSSNAASELTQTAIDRLAQNLQVEYELVSNIPNEQCATDRAEGKCFQAQLHLTVSEDFATDGWAIYFSHINRIQSVESREFTISPVNGVLHKLSLTEHFNGLIAGQTKTITFWADNWSLSLSDALPNYLVAADDSTSLQHSVQAKVIDSTRWQRDADTGLNAPAFASGYHYDNLIRNQAERDNGALVMMKDEALYQRYQTPLLNEPVANQVSLIPAPLQLAQHTTKPVVDLAKGVHIDFGNVESKSVAAALSRLAKLGIGQQPSGIPLRLEQSNKLQTPESYRLTISASEIRIIGTDAAGVFYGLQSLAGLIKLDDLLLPALTIVDQPHFGFRGMLVDVARNFRSQQFIVKLLDQMAAYKLNKLHLHIADDEGWRLQIPGLEELTAIGGQRCFDLQEQTCLLPQLGVVAKDDANNGYFTVAQYQQILQAASARHIQVIPSLDMPGHSRAAVVAMAARFHKYMQQNKPELANQYVLHDADDVTEYESIQYYTDNTLNVCQQSTYDFIDKVMTEVAAMHQAAGQPLTRYHIGADETAGAWVESPNCKALLANNELGISNASQLGAYFVERVSQLLAKKGIEVAAWSDGLEHTKTTNMPQIVQANAWAPLFFQGHHVAHQLANRDWQAVISVPDALYFDFPYQAHPKEHGYYWASRQTDTMKVFELMPENLPAHAEFWSDRHGKPYQADDRKQIDSSGLVTHQPLQQDSAFIGIQGQFWGENTYSDALAEFKIYPRLLALAERAWHQAEWAIPYDYQGAVYGPDSNHFTVDKRQQRAQDWQRFSDVVGAKELAKLEHASVNYRLPVVGFEVVADQLHAHIPFNGIAIEYRQNGGEWQPYHQPISAALATEFRSRSFDRTRFSRVSHYIGSQTEATNY
ncbi:carbohydate-binding domain-containing protein [Neiella marina]|uniref:beta-N-acetylhexosaminidase n=1 Tax=Neiella holothuriorum TaxID=2870530 RepID=A0ABS7EBT4_9GAMM|nr:family 20 glycosylhydrolase [Neiella holothuriorum]MBW8189428.1 carbohydate-binding domain-containing protein [Neiella holothuriorum]